MPVITSLLAAVVAPRTWGFEVVEFTDRDCDAVRMKSRQTLAICGDLLRNARGALFRLRGRRGDKLDLVPVREPPDGS